MNILPTVEYLSAKREVADLSKKVIDLTAQRDELLAACKRFVEEFEESYCECKMPDSPLMDGKEVCDYCVARAGIARCEKEPTT